MIIFAYFLKNQHAFFMPTPRQRNSRDDKSRPARGPKTPDNGRKRNFDGERSFGRPAADRADKKSFVKGKRGSFSNSKEDFSDRKPFKKDRFDDAPKSFGDRDKKPFRTGEKKPYRSDNFDQEGKPAFRKDKFSGKKRPFRSDKFDPEQKSAFKRDKFSGERPYQKTYSPRKSGPSKPSGKGPKKPSSSPKDDGLIRLNRYISNAGICSRRKADELIAAGVVSVNGEVVSELGFKVDPSKDVIRYNGETLKREKMVYVLLNKPKDYITTTDDPQERRTVMQLVEKASKERIYPVGRLDRNTTGLLLMTNDGDLADKLSHPRNNITKIYNVELNKSLTQGDMNKILFGLELEDGFIKPDDLSYVQGASKREVGIQIHSGKNRIVRRIFEHLGYEVVKLDRVIYANLTKKDLPRGRWRYLEEKEIIQLKHLIK